MGKNQYTWTEFYMKFADCLLAYKNNRNKLIAKLENVFKNTELKMPKLSNGNSPVDVDPFSVFGMFNKGLKDENRDKIIAALIKEFNVDAAVPDGYGGIPVLNPMQALFFVYDNREEDAIDNLWDLFAATIELDRKDSAKTRKVFCEKYDIVVEQPLVKWNITMGFFWIRPFRFINLDATNRAFIVKSTPKYLANELEELKRNLPDGEWYLDICDLALRAVKSKGYPCSSLPELSLAAFEQTSRDNTERRGEYQKVTSAVDSATGDAGIEEVRYWLFAPGRDANRWDEFYDQGIMGIGWYQVGDLSQYDSKEEIRRALVEELDDDTSHKIDAHALWQFANEMKPGDVVFVKKGRQQILGRGIVVSDYRYDENEDDWCVNIRDVKWTHKGEWPHPGLAAMKTLTEVTAYTDYVKRLEELFEDALDTPEIDYPTYTEDNFLEEVFMSPDDYRTLSSLVSKKKNVILQGPPGVGKTFIAKRLAYSIMGEKDSSRVMLVQFHQSYSYEDFIMGYRPTDNGFEIKRGAFYNFCKEAEIDSDNEYFFIIDEINRGNISKIFGELFMLVENDKRGPRNRIQLLYADELFYVPENVYIIGMMNTADRSLAMLDYALRRRFAFFTLSPAFDSEGFKSYSEELDDGKLNRLIQCVKRLNDVITNDESLGDGFAIGHSYFCNIRKEGIDDYTYSDIVEYELLPMLKEYWFDEPLKVIEWVDNLRDAIK